MEPLIIVAVRYRNKYRWFYGIREWWVLNWTDWSNSFSDGEPDVPTPNTHPRFQLDVVDERNCTTWFARMQEYEVSRYSLQDALAVAFMTAESWCDVADFFPIVLIDFDRRALYSLGSESPSFESYLPNGWTGRVHNFLQTLPRNEQYWIQNDVNILEQFQN